MKKASAGLNKKTIVALTLASTALVALSFVAFQGIQTVSQAAERQAKARTNLLTIGSVYSLVLELDTDQRGFAMSNLPDKLETLRSAFEENMEQGENFRRLKIMISDKMTGNPQTNLIENIRTLVSQMKVAEQIEIERENEIFEKAVKSSRYGVALSIALSFILFSVAAVFAKSHLKKRRMIEQAQQASEERVRLLLDSTAEAIYGMDLNGNCTFANSACVRMLGYGNVKELLGKNMHDLTHFAHADGSPYTREECRIYLAHINNANSHVDDEVFWRKDGTSFSTEYWSFPIRQDNKVVGTVVTFLDITARRQAERELIKAREAAVKASLAKSEFLANMSHEIRTPINGVIGMTDLLLESDLKEHQRKYVKIVQDCGTGLLNIINDILDFSKIEAGRMDLEVVDFDLAPLIESQADLLSQRAKEKGLSLMTFIDPSLPPRFKGDPGRISQVLLNLIGNAIKFTDQGTVVVRALPDGQTPSGDMMIRFSVQDTGIGLSESVKGRLFQPFTQADGSTAKKYGGTGLGLSICKKLVHLMGGQVGLDSKMGQGSTFWFTAQLKEAVSLTPAVVENKLDGIKVLIVNDDPPNAEIIASYTKSWKAQPTICAPGPACLEELRKVPGAYSIVICDLATGSSVRLDKQFKNIKLVLSTDDDRHLSQRDAAFAAVIAKPLKKRELYSAMVNALDDTQAEVKTKPAFALNKDQRRDSQGNVIRILVAEDNSVNQLIVSTQLKAMGYAPHVVSHGKEAIEALALSSYHLILMDCQMPEMDGYEATRTIRAQEEGTGRHIPIVALTANAMVDDEKRCLQSGMDDFITKPTKKETLEFVLARWLNTQQKAS